MPADLTAGVDEQEVGALGARAIAQALEGADQRDQVVLRLRRADEPECVGVREGLERQVVGVADVFHADGGRRPDGLLGDVGVDVGDRSPDPKRERGGRAGDGGLAGVHPAEEQDGVRMARRMVDELFVLVHGQVLSVHRRPRRGSWARGALDGFGVPLAQVLVDIVLTESVVAADADGLHLAVLDQPVHGHPGYAQ